MKSASISADMVETSLGVVSAKAFLASLPSDGLSCLEHIKAVACLSTQSNGSEKGYDPDCSHKLVPKDVIDKLPEIISSLPPIQRKVFCNVDRLQIEPNMKNSLAYASRIYAKEKVIGNMIGIRPGCFDENLQLDIFSWKEQLSFGLSTRKDPFNVSPQGVRIDFGIKNSKLPLTLNILTHELSHLIDFMNDVVAATWKKDNGHLKVTFKPGSYNTLSWPDYTVNDDWSGWPAPEFKKQYPWLSQMCFYSCGPTMTSNNAEDVYKELRDSTFLDAYSASGLYEDFAEASVAFLLKPAGLWYRVLDAKGTVLFDVDEAWKTPQRAAKLKWLKTFYARKDLKYKVDHTKIALKKN